MDLGTDFVQQVVLVLMRQTEMDHYQAFPWEAELVLDWNVHQMYQSLEQKVAMVLLVNQKVQRTDTGFQKALTWQQMANFFPFVQNQKNQQYLLVQ